MKAFYCILLFLMFFSNKSFSQCIDLPIIVYSSGFSDCTPSNVPGTICVSILSNLVVEGEDPPPCQDYKIRISFPTNSFLIDDLGLFNEIQHVAGEQTILEVDVDIIEDVDVTFCFTGFIQSPNPTFKAQVVHLDEENEIDDEKPEIYFLIDDYRTIGAPGTSTLLTELINSQDLLNAQDASLNAQKIIVNGNLIVNLNYSFGSGIGFRGRNEIIMGSGATITVMNGYELGFFKSDILPCAATWNRIEVGSGSQLELSNSTLSGANVGVDLLAASNLVIFKSEFENCEIAVGSFGSNYRTTNISYAANNFWTSRIKNCTYGFFLENTDQLNLLAPMYFENISNSGIYLKNTDLSGYLLDFSDCQYGIRIPTQNALVHLDDCNFDVGSTGIYTGGTTDFRVVNSEFKNLSIGIQKNSRRESEYSEIGSNTCEDVNRMLFVTTRGAFANVYSNNFSTQSATVTQFGVGFNNHFWNYQFNPVFYSEEGTNVILYNSRNSGILKNELLSNKRNILIKGGQGEQIGENNCGLINSNQPGLEVNQSPGNNIYCNGFIGEKGITIINECGGSILRRNDMTGSSYNLSYGTNLNGFANTGLQIDMFNSFDLSSIGNEKAINYSDEDVSDNNIFLVSHDLPQGSKYFPFYFSDSYRWFDPSGSGAISRCEPGSDGPDGPDGKRKQINSEIAVLNSGVGTAYGSEVEFDVKLKLLRTLSDLADYEPLNTEYQTWYNLLASSEVGGFIEFEETYLDNFQMNESTELNYNTILNETNTLISEVKLIENYSIVEDEVVFDPVLNNLYLSKLLQLESKKSDLNLILQGQESDFVSSISTLSAILNGLPYQNTVSGQNLEIVFNIMLDRLAGNPLSANDILTLEGIALQCAGYGGEGVFHARALLAELNPNTPIYNDECVQELGGIGAGSKQSMAGMKIFPNPSTGKVMVEFDLVSEDGEILVFDILGKLQFDTSITENTSRFSLDLSSLKPGVYFIFNSHTQEKVKVVLQQHD